MVVCFFSKQKTAYEMRISDWSSDVCSSDLATRAVIIHRPAHTDTIAVGLDIADVADPTDAPGLRGADFCSVRAGAHRRAFRVAPAITVAAEDRAVLVTRLADLRRKHRNAADDDCADDEVAKIDAPVVVPVSPRIGGRCDRGHEKRCGGGARQSAGHVAHGNRLLPIYAQVYARCAVCAMNE